MLLQGLTINAVRGIIAQQIAGVAYHSKHVRPGWLFVAVKGAANDGHAFVPAVVQAGAAVVVTERPVDVPSTVTNIVVPHARTALAQCAVRWYGDPSRQLRLVGVTGTNGKTTTTYLLEAVWRAAQRRPGVIGTVNVRYDGIIQPAPTTTPESLDLQAVLRTMCDAAVQDVIMEVSSHALDQGRVQGCHFDGAIFTNLTQDHLDYHADVSEYIEAKCV